MTPDDAALASVLRKLLRQDDAFLSLDTHGERHGFPVRFTLDDTTVEVTDRESLALKEELNW